MSSSKGFGANGGFGGKSGHQSRAGSRGGGVPYKNPHSDPLEGVRDMEKSYEQECADSMQAISAAYSGFRARARQEKQRFEFAVDADYWSGICFKSREDRNLFLEAVGVTRLYRGRHIDGYELARVLGLDLAFNHGE